MEQEQPTSLFDMNMDAGAQSSISSTSKWMRFIAITGFIALGLIVLVAAIAGNEVISRFRSLTDLGTDTFAGALIIVVILVVAIVGVWIFLMFKAANELKKGIESRSSAELTEGFKSLRTYFIFSIVFTVLTILFTVISFFQ